MGTLRVLLCCGAGFSSGFLAQKARQAAKKRKLDMSIDARSESVVSEYANKMDVLLVGPHYEGALAKLKEEYEPLGIKVKLIPSVIYSTLDGEELVNLAILAENEKGGTLV
ncbi:PTS sugar transporter subunit IIB [Lacrimispora sp.]|uniref:PTS sugar transporter subunit IIB n=1 Tax=Lacrimispora sp. TaxID=2719234 RepID=UPI0028A9F0CD|nr:PTS sugar transporter subunit IIB [Lacrimispora sp.]